MNIEIEPQDLAVILESLRYSKQRVQDAPGTPYDIRKQNLDRLDAVAEKLRNAKESTRPSQ